MSVSYCFQDFYDFFIDYLQKYGIVKKKVVEAPSPLWTGDMVLLATVGICLVCIIVRLLFKQNSFEIQNSFDVLNSFGVPYQFDFLKRPKYIVIQKNTHECDRLVLKLRKDCTTYKVLGFDCEWVTVYRTRNPIALLQLSSPRGLCALFRLCNMQQIPKSLRALLEDVNIIKVGVAPQDDALKLAHDFGVGVASTLDLRFLATLTGHRAEGLAKLSKSLLNVQLDKNWRLVCSDWEAEELTNEQIHYAAKDALVAVEILKKLARRLEARDSSGPFKQLNFASILPCLKPFYNRQFIDVNVDPLGLAKLNS